MDLYEVEYNEDFKKSIHGGGFIKNLVDTQVVPDHRVVVTTDQTNMLDQEIILSERDDKDVESSLIDTLKASSSQRMVVDYENRKSIEFIPPDEQSAVSERSIKSGFDSCSADFTEDSEGSTYLSSSRDDESDDARQRVRARTRKAAVKRKQSAEVSKSPERKQRNDMNKKMRTFQDLLPNSHKDDKESTLNEAINYMTNLQLQVQMMMMGNRFVTPSMMLPLDPYYTQMGLLPIGMGMQPQFLPENMLSILNHPGLMPMQNSSLFNPMENCYPQPPPCAASPEQLPKSTSLPNFDDPTTYTINQEAPSDGGKSKKVDKE